MLLHWVKTTLISDLSEVLNPGCLRVYIKVLKSVQLFFESDEVLSIMILSHSESNKT